MATYGAAEVQALLEKPAHIKMIVTKDGEKFRMTDHTTMVLLQNHNAIVINFGPMGEAVSYIIITSDAIASVMMEVASV